MREIRSARVALAATALPQSRFYLPAADGAVLDLAMLTQLRGNGPLSIVLPVGGAAIGRLLAGH